MITLCYFVIFCSVVHGTRHDALAQFFLQFESPEPAQG